MTAISQAAAQAIGMAFGRRLNAKAEQPPAVAKPKSEQILAAAVCLPAELEHSQR